ncbi:helix-turn-helix transcriptional regulator [Winogradskya consettensis]|uniref:Transcriptional regulator n=1 Tax=Winogradskya consettensis TaxID=113560 RepID=A0A919VJT5_9ACTN|nr:helix-turn-helix transcriptional regulator [Actinoplanes consettensis]GIM68680.1 transcriptional regulator [Actinoplanes consettensis]
MRTRVCDRGEAGVREASSWEYRSYPPVGPERTNRTRELATFLRSRRERLDPRDFDLPRRRQSRRTPGLRREEVAELAGVSTDYVVRLEQARGLRPSADVVEALAGALRLAPNERAYLFDLAQQRPRTADSPAATASPSLAGLVAELSPMPAMLLNHRFDILAWNDDMAALLVDFGALPPAQRNLVWLCLLHPQVRAFYLDRESVVRDGIAHLRTAWAAHPEDRALNELIAEFRTRDADFARLWAEPDVTVNGRGRKVMRHPDVGEITLNFEALTPAHDPDQWLLIFRPATDGDRSALEKLKTPTPAARSGGRDETP